jgi:hypothetical protein
MISILIIIFSLLLGGVGIVLFIREYQESRRILLGNETSKRIVIQTAVLYGLAPSLSFLALELLLAGLDKYHKWTIESILVMVTIPVFLDLMVTMGLIWQFYTSRKLRNYIFRKFAKKSDDDKKKVKK